MAKFKKQVMKPGQYPWGSITESDCQDFFSGVGEVHRAGLFVPLVMEHPPKKNNQVEGIPLPFAMSDLDSKWQEHKSQLVGTVGNVDFSDPRNVITAEGAVELVFDVPDETAAKQFRDGTVKFVSPEVRPGWYDAFTKRKFGKLMTHIAATHRPKQRDQMAGFLQLSDIDDSTYIPANEGDAGFIEIPTEPPTMAKQLSENDDTPEGKKSTTDAGGDQKPNANPDMPAAPVKNQQLEALLAHLTQMGLALPSDTTTDNLVERLLTAAMTFNAAQSKLDAEKDDDDPEAREDTANSGTMQFSENSPQDLLVKRIKKAGNKIPVSLRDMFLGKISALQFSDAGAEIVPAGSAGSLSDMLVAYEGLPEPVKQLSENALSPQEYALARIKKLEDENKVTPGIADMLRGKVPALQLSDAGEPTGDLPVLITHYEQGAGMLAHLLGDKTSAYQLSENGKVTSPVHPAGNEFYKGQDAAVIPVGDPRAKEVAADILAASGLGKPKAA